MAYRKNFAARFSIDVTPAPVLLALNTPTEADAEDISDEADTGEVTEPVTDPATIPADANTGGSNAGA